MESRFSKRIVIITIWLSIIVTGVFMIYSYVINHTFRVYGLFALSIFVASLLEFQTFGHSSYLGNRMEKGDELEEHIVRVSSKISYFVLMGIILLILGYVDWKNGSLFGDRSLSNLPLLLALCASIVTLPVVQFIVARRFK